jgi:hypothetical protein
MAHEYTCEQCDEKLADDSYEGVIKRAAAHNHEHHGGPAEITPEIEAALRANVRQT